jgi:signal transduction histidine kinase
LNRIFLPFERTQQGQNSGAGLGLTLVKNIVEMHGGTIGIKSALNEGTSVWVELPAL